MAKDVKVLDNKVLTIDGIYPNLTIDSYKEVDGYQRAFSYGTDTSIRFTNGLQISYGYFFHVEDRKTIKFAASFKNDSYGLSLTRESASSTPTSLIAPWIANPQPDSFQIRSNAGGDIDVTNYRIMYIAIGLWK